MEKCNPDDPGTESIAGAQDRAGESFEDAVSRREKGHPFGKKKANHQVAPQESWGPRRILLWLQVE